MNFFEKLRDLILVEFQWKLLTILIELCRIIILTTDN